MGPCPKYDVGAGMFSIVFFPVSFKFFPSSHTCFIADSTGYVFPYPFFLLRAVGEVTPAFLGRNLTAGSHILFPAGPSCWGYI